MFGYWKHFQPHRTHPSGQLDTTERHRLMKVEDIVMIRETLELNIYVFVRRRWQNIKDFRSESLEADGPKGWK